MEFCLYVLVIASFLTAAADGLACSYQFPEYQNPQTCLEYDLTQLSHYGPYNISGPGIYTLYVKVINTMTYIVYNIKDTIHSFAFCSQVCDFISTDMPDACVSKYTASATAYLYSVRGECYPLGQLEHDFAVRNTINTMLCNITVTSIHLIHWIAQLVLE